MNISLPHHILLFVHCYASYINIQKEYSQKAHINAAKCNAMINVALRSFGRSKFDTHRSHSSFSFIKMSLFTVFNASTKTITNTNTNMNTNSGQYPLVSFIIFIHRNGFIHSIYALTNTITNTIKNTQNRTDTHHHFH